MQSRTSATSTASITLMALLAMGCSTQEKPSKAASAAADSSAGGAAVPCKGDTAGLTLPAGFCATVFADSLQHARHVAVASNGDVYVTIENRGPSADRKAATTADGLAPQPTSFVALRDTSHDGRADIVKRVGTVGNTGVAVSGGYVYVDEGASIVRYARADSQLVPTGREVIVSGIPIATGHKARNIAIGADGSLYLNVGSATNSCQQKDRVNESKGVDPCVELETRAGIWQFKAGTRDQAFGPQARYATGIRNAMGLAVGPDGKLYATQHGRDQLHDNWPALFPTTVYQAENPAEELVQVNAGDDFGWPYCYYAVEPKKLVDAPEYGGDGTKSGRCDSKKEPLVAFPAHWAPMSLLFYRGRAFPARYASGAFIAFHGSWNRAPEPQAGYRVVFQPMTNGAPSGGYETFADGFAGVPAAQLQPGTALHRPTGLAAGPDGALYVTDDLGGRIYRITYGGPR